MRRVSDYQFERPLTRRTALQVGGIAALGLSLEGMLAAEDLVSNQRDSGSSPKSCIFIHQYGGLSQLDSWDMKPNAPREIRGPYESIATSTPGFQICELMPRLAGISEKYSVIRSMTHHMAQHDKANSMLLAGKRSPAENDPSFGAIVSKLSPAQASIPAHVWLQKYGGGSMPPEHTYLTGGYLGMAYAPMLIGEKHNDGPDSDDFRVHAFDTNESVSMERLEERWRLLKGLQNTPMSDVSTAFESTDIYQQQSFDLLHSDTAKSAFDINRESPATRDRFGRNPLGQNLLLARRLIESGVRLVNVVAWTGLAAGEEFVSLETWDMHGNANVGIFENGWNGLPFALPRTDQAVATLLEDLSERGLLDSTLVVLIGEFGRTPVISKGAKRIGRDHWPSCYSAMVAGAGIRGGNVYGESDSRAAYVKSSPVTLEDFTATLFKAMSLNPAARLSPNGFTNPASTGEPIAALL
ncbi:MAG: DUF1501 domain-containing protein [Planctomycetaceae bacterium]|nr:DUF1501 domain-containing protein [Planctomycetaceae bacterium]MCB9952847.1 DUF1501 domain-containing protein [Planctomycetaceae bacterium]